MRKAALGRPAGIWAGLCLGTCVSALPGVAQAYDFPPVDFGGYVKLDTLYSHFGDGAVAQSITRDFYVPGATPVAGPGAASHSYLDFSAKETRLWLSSHREVEGYKVGAYVEVDFLSGQNPQTAGTLTPNETTTNAYNPALRRAYLTVDNFEFGQDWSTFQNVAVLPETADFIGVEDGTVFVRQPQIRYTLGGFQAALENPETWAYTPQASGTSTAVKTDDNLLPDVVLRYNFKAGGFGDFSIAGLGRQLKVQNPSASGGITGADDTAYGWGGSFSGKLPVPLFEGDDIRFMVTGGRGLGRYIALSSIADAGIESGKFKPVTAYDGFIAYHHQWSQKWRSNLMLAALQGNGMAGDNIGGNVTRRTESAAANLFYSPIKNISIGGEYRYGKRSDVAGAKGSLDRVEFTAKYLF